ncbi:dienelactone hydrolase endo-1-3,1,4-beta-D-glucanase [Amylostereum chailletii]|nr:dienelactone hydrolase endo-1-3,1,4-beta-D-glucanase [Amylostereum chailletii]
MSCENCRKGYILPGTPQGSVVDGIYLSPSTDATPSKSAVVLLTDIFGLPLVNCKIIADHFAKELGMDVWVPDLFNGSPPIAAEDLELLMPDRAGVKLSFMQIIRLVFLMLPQAYALYTNRASVGAVRVTAVLEKMKAEKKYETIGAVGYCHGGSVAACLGNSPLLSSIVIAHPGQASEAQIRAITLPTAWVLAEDDLSFKPPAVELAKKVFSERKAEEYEFKTYPGTAHGFAARPNLGIPEVKAGYEGALEQTIAWFKKTL